MKVGHRQQAGLNPLMAVARRSKTSRFWLKALFALYLFTLAIAVFTPVQVGSNGWIALIGANLLLEKLINLGLLAPLSFFVYRLGARLSTIQNASVLLLISGTIESIQLFIPGRVSDLLDVALNLLGGVCVHMWVSRSPGWSKR